MEKIELLAPAGNKDCLYMAIHAGADAVYISGKKYGARKFADNFDNQEIVDAIKYCHLYGVKVYVTLNTLIFNNEIEDFLEYAKFLHKNNVDAVIVQDIGMIKLLRTVLPNLEIHASTQTHNYNIETTKMFKELGVKRVVLARELTLDEINEHSKLLDTEVFVHGAICMSYSGCCYMSLLRGGRSGNRGECAGSCRLPYINNGKKSYYLSTKDLCNINEIDKIIKSGTKSIKIEGRMKSKEYVYLVTKMYRKTIDEFYKTNNIKIDKELYEDIKKVFNREYTKGHKVNDKDIMNPNRPNHQGVSIGQVIKLNEKFITIKLTKSLLIGDGIKFTSEDTGFTITNIYVNGESVKSAKAGQIISLKNTVNLKTKTEVVKTTDKELTNKLKDIEEKKIKIDCNCYIYENKIQVEYKDENNKVVQTKEIVEEAKNSPTTIEEIKKQLSKLGNTPFVIKNISINEIENIFINKKELNEIRRELIEELIKKRTENKKEIIINSYKSNIKMDNSKYEINVSVTTEEQYKVLKQLNINNIYTTNYELYEKYKTENIYYIMPRIINKKYEDMKNIVINDYNYIPRSSNVIANYYLNLTNEISCSFAIEKGIKKICVSPELNIENIKNLSKNNINLEIQIYGYLEAMITKNDIKQLKEINSNNYTYRIIDNNNYISIITESKNNIKLIKEYEKIGIKKYRLDFFDENPKTIEKIILEVKKELKEILPF